MQLCSIADKKADIIAGKNHKYMIHAGAKCFSNAYFYTLLRNIIGCNAKHTKECNEYSNDGKISKNLCEDALMIRSFTI